MSNPYLNQEGVLINKLGITDRDTLKQVEYDITSQKQREILDGSALQNIKGFGFERQQAIHKHLFEDIYEWAGKPRTVPYRKHKYKVMKKANQLKHSKNRKKPQ